MVAICTVYAQGHAEKMSAQQTTLVTYWCQVPFHSLEYGYSLEKSRADLCGYSLILNLECLRHRNCFVTLLDGMSICTNREIADKWTPLPLCVIKHTKGDIQEGILGR